MFYIVRFPFPDAVVDHLELKIVAAIKELFLYSGEVLAC